MALKTPYATNLEADAYLSESDAWQDLESSQKTEYLTNGRYFIDSNYTCTELDDADPIPDEYKYANTLLAEMDLSTGIFSIDKTGGSPVVSKKVKAGSVESETSYAGQFSASTKMNAIDPHPQVTSLLSEFCTLNKSSSTKSVSLLRA